MTGARASDDRLLIALVIATAVHAIVLLGLRFELPKPSAARKTLAVTLVRSPSRKAPDQADYLAAQHQIGSGSVKPKPLRRTPAPPSPEFSGQPLEAEGSSRRTEPQQADSAKADAAAPNRTEARPQRLLSRLDAERKIAAGDGATPDPAQPETAEALRRQISEMSQQLSHSLEAEAQNPRVVYINSVNAHQYKAAAYEHAWQQKVERIGNLHYPDEARQQQLSGSLVLAVALLPDGTVAEVQVRQSSGHPLLDSAAERIVRLASPFTPFPAELRKTTDVLVITRTWRFYNDYRLETE